MSNSLPPPPASPSFSPAPPPRGWFSRNWKWFLPVGCLGFAGLIGAAVLAIIIFVFGMIKQSDVYQNSVVTAQTHPAVVEALGSPVEVGFFVSGKTETNDASGRSEIAIPISGPKGKGKIYAVGDKSAGQWEMRELVVEIEKTGERIDLLGEAQERLEESPAEPEPDEEPAETTT